MLSGSDGEFPFLLPYACEGVLRVLFAVPSSAGISYTATWMAELIEMINHDYWHEKDKEPG